MKGVLAGLALVDGALRRIEVALVCASLGLMVGLKFADVLLRKTGHGGIPAFAVAVQHLVLWVGMLGATLATAERKHLSLEVLTSVIPSRWRRPSQIAVAAASVFVCALLAYVAWRWIGVRVRPRQVVLFTLPILDLPLRRWWSLAVIPVAFAVMAFRFLLQMLDRTFGGAACDPRLPSPGSGGTGTGRLPGSGGPGKETHAEGNPS